MFVVGVVDLVIDLIKPKSDGHLKQLTALYLKLSLNFKVKLLH